MRLKRFFCTLLLIPALIAVGRSADSQELMFQALTVSDGLSQSHVGAIEQDHHGFMWFGTGGGLSRYDGHEFEIFRHQRDDPRSLSADAVYSLHVDHQGQVWVGTETALNRFDQGSDSFERYIFDPSNANSPAPGWVGHIASEEDGTIWASTANWDVSRGLVTCTVNRLDPDAGTVDRFEVSREPQPLVEALHVDRSGAVWAGIAHFQDDEHSEALGLYRFDPEAGAFEKVPLDQEAGGKSLGIMAIAEDDEGMLWLGTWGRGIATLDPASLEVTWYGDNSSSDATEIYIRDLAIGLEGLIWAVTSPGPTNRAVGDLPGSLIRLSTNTGRIEIVRSHPANAHGMGEHILITIHHDRFGSLWVGTSGAGLRYADSATPAFSLFRHNPTDADSLGSNFVRSIFADNPDRIWVGTDHGLDVIDREIGNVDHWVHDPTNPHGLGPGTVEAIHRDRRGQLWIGAPGGVYRFDPVAKRFTGILHDPDDPTSLSDPFVTVIGETRDGFLWIGTRRGGLNRLDPRSGSIRRFPSIFLDESTLPGHEVLAVSEGRDGRLWVATSDGLAYVDLASESVHRVATIADLTKGIPNHGLTSLLLEPDNPGRLWIGTRNAGLLRLDTEHGDVERIDLLSYGVHDNLVYAILPGPDGALWISTNFGLLRFVPSKNLFRLFSAGRGIQAPEFNHRAAYRGLNGELYFGGVNGLNVFDPRVIVDNPFPPEVVITSVAVLRRDTAHAGTPHEIVHHLGQPSKLLKLTSNNRDLVFDFVALHSTEPSSGSVSYRLDGFETAWHEGPGIRTATYTNLDPGRYAFRVKAANAHGVWNEEGASIDIEILPPLWGNWWFRVLSLVGIAAVLGTVYRWRVGVLQRREQLLEHRVVSRTAELRDALTTIEAQTHRLGELDQAKSRFFANVSHEFRTPLTLTLGPLQDLREGYYGQLPGEAVEDLDIAIRNSRRLLRLVNQLLDTAKVEAGQLRPRIREIDLRRLLDNTALSFGPLAERRHIAMEINLGERAIPIWVDREMIEQVFTNLLSNAFKFTPEGGKVQVRLSEHPSRGEVHVEVQDSGEGIPPELLPHIFDRFFQASESRFDDQVGTGLGLALARELVDLHDGEIHVRSVQGLGTTLSVKLKMGREHLAEDLIEVESPPPTDHSTTVPEDLEDAVVRENGSIQSPGASMEEDTTTVLVVDDSSEIRRFVRRHLETEYRVIEAEDGEEGLNVIRAQLPDVVISDIIMPKLDGVALCKAVKTDPELDFIPVVLLTAKASTNSRVEGLESGADDYLTKPFEVRELQARVANLICSRQRLQERMEANVAPRSTRSPRGNDERSDSTFAENVRAVIDEEMTDEDFGVEDLARALNMSRVHLYRRMGEELDEQPNELIIRMRLDRAADLLRSHAGSVAEVAYGVGFKSVSHFTKRFRQRFDMTPTSFRITAPSEG